jgi:hypothetical protein
LNLPHGRICIVEIDGLDLLLIGFNQQKPFNPRTHVTIGVVENTAKMNFHEY